MMAMSDVDIIALGMPCIVWHTGNALTELYFDSHNLLYSPVLERQAHIRGWYDDRWVC